MDCNCKKIHEELVFLYADDEMGQELDTVVFLSADGVWAAVKGEAEKITYTINITMSLTNGDGKLLVRPTPRA